MCIKKIVLIGLFILLLSSLGNAATIRVNSVLDGPAGHDSNPGDGICDNDFGAGTCSLRTALEEANATVEADSIFFVPSLTDAVLVLAASEGPLPAITGGVTILGTPASASATLLRDAAPQYTIDGSQLSGLPSGLVFQGAAASNSRVSTLGIINFAGNGILIRMGAVNIDIDGNYIGVRPSDFAAAGNGFNGIHILDSGGHRIGKIPVIGDDGFQRLGNVVSSSGRAGIRLENANSNRALGNLVGLSASGTGARGNGRYGIHVNGNNNLIGDSDNSESAGNFIAANEMGSVVVTGDANSVRSNSLGRDETGSFIASEGDGIAVFGSNNNIGRNETSTYGGNEIYEHAASAIRLGTFGGASASSNFVIGNQIGSAGSQVPSLLSGNGAGINLANGSSNEVLDNVVINSFGNSSLTLIGSGVSVRGNSNTLEGNRIGFVTTMSGPNIESNQFGISINGNNNTVGSAARPNIVGGNDGDGIVVFGDGNSVLNNYVGVTEAFIDIGNNSNGLFVENSSVTTVSDNVIGFNNDNGLVLSGIANTLIIGNWIGIAPDGRDIGNAANAVSIQSGNSTNLLQNHLAFNLGNGITTNSDISGIAWFQNFMHDNLGIGIDLNDDGITANDVGDVDEGPNRLQNFPVIEDAILDRTNNPSTLTITYRVDSNPGTATYPMNIDFYWSDIDEPAQGRFFLGTDTGYTTANAIKIVTFNISNGVLGGWLTATTLDQDRNTSELAARFEFGDSDEVLFKDGFEGAPCASRFGSC